MAIVTTVSEKKKTINQQDNQQQRQQQTQQNNQNVQQSADSYKSKIQNNINNDSNYRAASETLKAAEQNAPTYMGTYDDAIKDAYDKVMGFNSKGFEYDINDDALYQMYADKYQQMGKLAMKDTMGQAAALTGGYGSSYGQQVGQQTYDAYLQNLNDIVPELYDRAYGRWQDQGNALKDQYAMAKDMGETEYSRFVDDYNRWNNERNYAKQNEADAYNRAAQVESDAYQRGYTDSRDAIADQRYQNEWDYQMTRDEIADQRYQDETDYARGIDQRNWDYQLQQDDEAKQRESAQLKASYGDYSGYADLLGWDEGSVSAAQLGWIASNPELAYRQGYIDADQYYKMTGEYAPGYEPQYVGQGGPSDDGNDKTDGAGKDTTNALINMALGSTTKDEAVERINQFLETRGISLSEDEQKQILGAVNNITNKKKGTGGGKTPVTRINFN